MFDVVNEKKEFKLGNVITVFSVPGINKEFILFSIEGMGEDKSNLEIAYLNRGSDGYDYISEIDDLEHLKKAMEVVKNIVNVTKIR